MSYGVITGQVDLGSTDAEAGFAVAGVPVAGRIGVVTAENRLAPQMRADAANAVPVQCLAAGLGSYTASHFITLPAGCGPPGLHSR